MRAGRGAFAVARLAPPQELYAIAREEDRAPQLGFDRNRDIGEIVVTGDSSGNLPSVRLPLICAPSAMTRKKIAPRAGAPANTSITLAFVAL